ncbi:MAG TPA: 50S ribosomal protein L11 methyltransferase, partial [Thermoanaerobaculia bacterium]
MKFSRLLIPRKAGEDFVVGLLSLHDPLGLQEDGRDLVACFRLAPAAREAAAALAERGIRCEVVTDIAEGDPLEAFRAASKPFPVGRRFWLDPGDPSDSSPPEGRIALRLPASRAFGTGGHESTRLAIVALEEEGVEGRAVLDVGTGSGVLALAAAALGSPRAVGYDTDLEAIFVARENVRRHPFGDRVCLAAAAAPAVGGAFPVVVANLLPDELFSIRTEVLARVEPG